MTCALGDLGFGHFGKLGLCIPWVTWTLNNLLLNLIIGKFDVLKNLTRAFMAESISGLFYIIKPRRIEHLQKEEPFSSDPYFRIK